MSPMSPWGDILTEQLRGDILIDHQQGRTGTLTRLPGRGRVTAPVRTYSPDGGGGMARSGLLRRLFTASMAVLFGLAALTTAAHAQTKGGVIRVGNLGEPPPPGASCSTP